MLIDAIRLYKVEREGNNKCGIPNASCVKK